MLFRLAHHSPLPITTLLRTSWQDTRQPLNRVVASLYYCTKCADPSSHPLSYKDFKKHLPPLKEYKQKHWQTVSSLNNPNQKIKEAYQVFVRLKFQTYLEQFQARRNPFIV